MLPWSHNLGEQAKRGGGESNKRKRKTSSVIGLVIVFFVSAEKERVVATRIRRQQQQHLSCCLSSRLLSPLALNLRLVSVGSLLYEGRGPWAHEKVDQVKTDLQENKLRLASTVLFKTTSTTKYTDRHTTNSAGRLREIWMLARSRSRLTDRVQMHTELLFFFPPFFSLKFQLRRTGHSLRLGIPYL